ncbi:MAG: hypothetical protein R6U11_08600 [Bacteroidales bacterium]
MKKFAFILLVLVVASGFYSCKKDQSGLVTFQNEMKNSGYEGRFEKIKNPLHKIALTAINIKDMVVFSSKDMTLFAFAIQMRSENDISSGLNIIETVSKVIMENSENESLNEEQLNWDKIKENMITNKEYVLFWQGKGEDKMLEAFGSL